MAAVFAANYDGLKKRETYDSLVDQLGTDKLKEPNRRAKQLRETPEISGLLDGEGSLSFVEMGRQQVAAAKHAMVEASVREAASVPGAPSAQELRVAETQTSGPRMRNARTQAGVESSERFSQTRTAQFADTGSQAWRSQTTSGGTQTDPAAQMFDLAADDRMDEGMRNLEAEMDEFAKLLETQQKSIVAKVAKNLGQEVSPAQQDFAHRMATAASASSGAASASEVQTMDEDRSEAVKRKPAAEGSAPKAKSKTKGEGKAKAKVLEPPMEVSAPEITGKRQADRPDGNGNGNARAKPKKRATKPDPALPAPASSSDDPGGQPASSSAEPAASTGDTGGSGEAPRKHGIEKIEGKSKSWWTKQNIQVIKDQAELRGHRFTELDVKGGMVRKGGKQVKQPKMKKAEYLETLFRVLGL